MGNTMKYRIKNEKLAELVYAVFDEEIVQQTIAERIDDGSYRISFGSGEICHAKVNPEHEYLEKTYSAVFLAIDKKEIEQVREFDPEGWNPYPEVEPPRDGWYLIQWKKGQEGSGDEPLIDVSYLSKNRDWIGIEAFRALPEMYKPEEQECPNS